MKRALLVLLVILAVGCGEGMGDEDLGSSPFEPPAGGESSSTCDSASDLGYYQVAFSTDWIAANFEDYPDSNPHFSTFIGAAHNDSVTYWEPGGMATQGIQDMAERGITFSLASEISTQAGQGNSSGSFTGATLYNPPATRTINFLVTGEFPRITLVSMIAPSPDWFVGVNGLDLCGISGWKSPVTVDAFVYDAGTDSGTDFHSADAVENPQLPIAQITGPPFRDMPDGTPRRVGTFTFTLQ